jgi:hypothetical protein
MAHGPAFAVPPDLLGAGNLRVWFTDPPGAIVQLSQPARGTKEMAEWLVGPGFARLRGRFPAAEMILVIDLSLMEGRDSAAREVMIDKAREPGRIFARTFMIPPLKASAVYMATLHAASALFNALGRDINIERSLSAVIAQCELKPARPIRP